MHALRLKEIAHAKASAWRSNGPRDAASGRANPGSGRRAVVPEVQYGPRRRGTLQFQNVRSLSGCAKPRGKYCLLQSEPGLPTVLAGPRLRRGTAPAGRGQDEAPTVLTPCEPLSDSIDPALVTAERYGSHQRQTSWSYSITRRRCCKSFITPKRGSILAMRRAAAFGLSSLSRPTWIVIAKASIAAGDFLSA